MEPHSGMHPIWQSSLNARACDSVVNVLHCVFFLARWVTSNRIAAMVFARNVHRTLKVATIGWAILFVWAERQATGDDAEALLLEFLDRWQAIKEFDVVIEADIESKTNSERYQSRNWMRHSVIRLAKMEGKMLLAVEMTSLSDENLGEVSYKYLEVADKRWFGNDAGEIAKGTEKMNYGGVEIDFSNSMQIKPFNPWTVTISGENALFRGSRGDVKITEAFQVDKILESSETAEGTHAAILGKDGSIVYEVLFDKEFDGMPSMINMFPHHKEINLKNPSTNTRYFYRSKVAWRKMLDGWFVSGAVVDSIDGLEPDVIRVNFDSKWTWAEKVDGALFTPPALQAK